VSDGREQTFPIEVVLTTAGINSISKGTVAFSAANSRAVFSGLSSIGVNLSGILRSQQTPK
jgi:hypothetical protein